MLSYGINLVVKYRLHWKVSQLDLQLVNLRLTLLLKFTRCLLHVIYYWLDLLLPFVLSGPILAWSVLIHDLIDYGL